ncbi:ABC transporter permease [Pseudalkalibacillus salsuginis]|uniref:ABC transporter permease n=1 Tax=Pseudalkalibacillus salsuginis TaxID=2910972 RepID=UPI001F20FAA8|nr:ABC transporter permease [Pseudalkalibacillus salsuginis]MCF6411117.1 ABC transporter permease [Pseudalkalibacillus salsuginis]
MFSIMFPAVESGVIYALMALGVYLSFRILDFPDLTVDGSFVTGAGVAAIILFNGQSPILATLAGMGSGFIAGCITGVLHTKGKINPLLSGILMMIALYSINLRIMQDRPNIPLLNQETIFSQFEALWDKIGIDEALSSAFAGIGLNPSTWSIMFLMILITLTIKFFTDWFLKTEIGLALRATGDNKQMIRSFSADTNTLTVLGLGVSNAFVALSGALIAQYNSFADIGMGLGMIIIGLASVIIGEALFGTKTIMRTTLAVIGGAIIYRIVISIALKVGFNPGDMKLITATLVVIALILPKILDSQKERNRKKRKRLDFEKMYAVGPGKEGKNVASTKSDSQSI